jgi:hypothetical protein
VAGEPWAVADLVAALVRRAEIRKGEAELERAVHVGTDAFSLWSEGPGVGGRR